MSMTVYTAHIYVMAEGKGAYFELSYDNEMNPELAIKDSTDTFIDAFNNKSDREKLVSEAFDANYLWEDDEPYYLKDEVEFSDFNGFPSKDFRKFCKEIKSMDKIQYVLFAVDSNKRDWLGYATYWYDAIVFDFAKRHLITIEWRGTELQEDDDYLEEKPFYKSTAEYLTEKLESGAASQIDVGDFVLNGKLAGKITENEIPSGNVQGEKTSKAEINQSSSVEGEEEKQIERISSLIKKVNSIEFDNKAFVFDRLDYVPINGEFHGPDSPEHPVVKKVIEAGGLMRKNISGKTNYLVLNNHAAKSGMGKKCKDALAQIDKGKDLTIITVDNLMKVLSSSEPVSEAKSIKANTDTDRHTHTLSPPLTFNGSNRVTIDGDLETLVPDGYHYGTKDKAVTKTKQDSEKEKKSLQRKISYRKREIGTLSSELEQLEKVGNTKEDKAKYIENVLEERYRTLRELNPVDWSQEPEIEKFVRETDSEFGQLRREYEKNHGYEMHEIKTGIYNSLYDPELQYHVERLQMYAKKYIEDLTRIFKRVVSRTEDFDERGTSASSMKKLVDLMDAIYKEGEKIKISFNDSVNEVTMVYEYMPVECGISLSSWRSYQKYMPEDIDVIDRQKEAKATKNMQEKLNYAQTAYEKAKNRLEEAESEPDRNSRELANLEEELQESLANYDADKIIIQDNSNTAVEALQKQLTETVNRKEKKIKEKHELEAALDKAFALAFSKKNKYKEEISAIRSVIMKLESDEEDLEERIRINRMRKGKSLSDLDSKISNLKSRIAKIKKQSETLPDRIASLKEELNDKKEELFKVQRETDSFHIEYLIKEHSDILQELSEQISNKQKRIEKLKGEIARFEGEFTKASDTEREAKQEDDKLMKRYHYDNHAPANDKLAVYVLLTENDYEDECYREIHGISYDLDCIEKIIDEISSNSEFDDNTHYIVHRIKQMKDELFQSEFQLNDSVRKECYIVFRGPVLETTEELLGYFKDRQDAVYYAGIASSFEETDDIIIIKAPMDTYFDFTNVESASAEDGFEFE